MKRACKKQYMYNRPAASYLCLQPMQLSGRRGRCRWPLSHHNYVLRTGRWGNFFCTHHTPSLIPPSTIRWPSVVVYVRAYMTIISNNILYMHHVYVTDFPLSLQYRGIVLYIIHSYTPVNRAHKPFLCFTVTRPPI